MASHPYLGGHGSQRRLNPSLSHISSRPTGRASNHSRSSAGCGWGVVRRCQQPFQGVSWPHFRGVGVVFTRIFYL